MFQINWNGENMNDYELVLKNAIISTTIFRLYRAPFLMLRFYLGTLYSPLFDRIMLWRWLNTSIAQEFATFIATRLAGRGLTEHKRWKPGQTSLIPAHAQIICAVNLSRLTWNQAKKSLTQYELLQGLEFEYILFAEISAHWEEFQFYVSVY